MVKWHPTTAPLFGETPEARLAVEGGMGIENSNIKIGSFEPSSPETIGSNVQTSTILSILCDTPKSFPSDWLQFRFNTKHHCRLLFEGWPSHLISLCLMEEKACSTNIHTLMEVTSCTRGLEHHEKPPCEVRSWTPQLAVKLTRRRLLFPEQGSWTAWESGGEIVSIVSILV